VEEAVMGALATYPGACPVWIEDRRIGQRYQLPKNRWIKASEEALGCLRDILGPDRVRRMAADEKM
jgi:hypothetical protein